MTGHSLCKADSEPWCMSPQHGVRGCPMYPVCSSAVSAKLCSSSCLLQVNSLKKRCLCVFPRRRACPETFFIPLNDHDIRVRDCAAHKSVNVYSSATMWSRKTLVKTRQHLLPPTHAQSVVFSHRVTFLLSCKDDPEHRYIVLCPDYLPTKLAGWLEFPVPDLKEGSQIGLKTCLNTVVRRYVI